MRRFTENASVHWIVIFCRPGRIVTEMIRSGQTYCWMLIPMWIPRIHKPPNPGRSLILRFGRYALQTASKMDLIHFHEQRLADRTRLLALADKADDLARYFQ